MNISLPDEMVDRIDTMIRKRDYASRSELVRSALRDFLVETEWMSELAGHALAVVTTTFDTESKGVSDEVNRLQHRYQNLILTTIHSHMGRTCLEVILAKGDISVMRKFAEELKDLRGVRKVKVTVA
jgi:CopG family nickel-responsive transcriptional regulator